jgi:ribonuclease P protein component
LNTLKRYFFRKENKLKSRKIIQQIFAEGNSFTVFPLKVLWLDSNEHNCLQTGVSVSSRYFKRAVDRNKIKRLIRESYRLQKFQLEEYLLKEDHQLSVFLIYISKEMPDYQMLYAANTKIINKLIKAVNEKHQ